MKYNKEIKNLNKEDRKKLRQELLNNIQAKKEVVDYKVIEVSELVELIMHGDIIENFIIKGDINHNTFEKIIEKDSIERQYKIKLPVILRNCKIEKINLKSVRFENKFEIRSSVVESVVLSYAHFEKGVNFSTTVFNSDAIFFRSWFYYNAYFSDTTFNAKAEFHSTYYYEYAFFHNAFFKKDANFSSSTFKNRTLFPNIITNYIDFSYSRIYNLFVLNNTGNLIHEDEIEKYLGTTEVVFNGVVFIDTVDLSDLDCKSIDLSNSDLRGSMNLTGTKFHEINFENFRFNELLVNTEQLVSYENGKETYKLTTNNNKTLMSIFNKLKKNYQTLQQYDNEDWTYREYRRTELYIKKEEGRLLEFYLGKYLFDKLFCFGTSAARSFGVLLLSIIIYLCVYSIFGINSELNGIINEGFNLRKFGNYIYFTLITFTTIGYGEITPSGIMKLVAASEGFVGIFLTTIFTVTFSRKLIR